MIASLASRVMDAISTVEGSYYRLILVVGPARCGKTAALSVVAATNGWARLNVNLHLSGLMLDLTRKQRKIRTAAILEEILRVHGGPVAVLDNIEMLFAEELEQDPLRLLQLLARNRTVVAAWPGRIENGFLTYAETGHPEARRYGDPDACLVGASADLGLRRAGTVDITEMSGP